MNAALLEREFWWERLSPGVGEEVVVGGILVAGCVMQVCVCVVLFFCESVCGYVVGEGECECDCGDEEG